MQFSHGLNSITNFIVNWISNIFKLKLLKSFLFFGGEWRNSLNQGNDKELKKKIVGFEYVIKLAFESEILIISLENIDCVFFYFFILYLSKSKY